MIMDMPLFLGCVLLCLLGLVRCIVLIPQNLAILGSSRLRRLRNLLRCRFARSFWNFCRRNDNVWKTLSMRLLLVEILFDRLGSFLIFDFAYFCLALGILWNLCFVMDLKYFIINFHRLFVEIKHLDDQEEVMGSLLKIILKFFVN